MVWLFSRLFRKTEAVSWQGGRCGHPQRLRLRTVLLGVSAALVCGSGSAAGIYTCIDARGHRLTADRPIPECLDREQRILNKDGSEQQRRAPTPTADEVARQEELARKRALEDNARRVAARQDRNLLSRYPNQASHDRARTSAQEPQTKALESAERRLMALAEELKKLEAEAEFYKGKDLPLKLKQQFEHNKTSKEAQRIAIRDHQDEIKRVNALYDEELSRLRQLWNGVAPGSLAATANSGTAPPR